MSSIKPKKWLMCTLFAVMALLISLDSSSDDVLEPDLIFKLQYIAVEFDGLDCDFFLSAYSLALESDHAYGFVYLVIDAIESLMIAPMQGVALLNAATISLETGYRLWQQLVQSGGVLFE